MCKQVCLGLNVAVWKIYEISFNLNSCEAGSWNGSRQCCKLAEIRGVAFKRFV